MERDYEIEYLKKCLEIEKLRFELLLQDIYGYLNYNGDPGDGEYFHKKYDQFINQ